MHTIHTNSGTLTVTDRGSGMAPADAEHAFDRFYRADAARGRDSGGSGLGLAIAKAIVDAHGGTIELATAPGAGTRVAVCLPRVRSDVVPAAPAPVLAPAPNR